MRKLFIVPVLFVLACGSKQAAPSPQPAPTEQTGSAAPSGMTAAQCTAAGGEVVGDIGDGATSRPDYKCAKSGQPPLGPIMAEPGAPQAIEGAVCCK